MWYNFVQTQNINDWAAPVIHYARALELELNRRLYERAKQGQYYPPNSQSLTLGPIINAHRYRQPNWYLFKETVSALGGDITKLAELLEDMYNSRILDIRNNAAHGRQPINEVTARVLRDMVIGTKDGLGFLQSAAKYLQPIPI